MESAKELQKISKFCCEVKYLQTFSCRKEVKDLLVEELKMKRKSRDRKYSKFVKKKATGGEEDGRRKQVDSILIWRDFVVSRRLILILLVL